MAFPLSNVARQRLTGSNYTDSITIPYTHSGFVILAQWGESHGPSATHRLPYGSAAGRRDLLISLLFRNFPEGPKRQRYPDRNRCRPYRGGDSRRHGNNEKRYQRRRAADGVQ